MLKSLRRNIEIVKTHFIGDGSSLQNRFLKGFIWSFLNVVLGQGLNFVSNIILARSLGKEIFGQLWLIINTFTTFGIFLSFGFGITLTKYLASYKTADIKKAGLLIGNVLLIVCAVSLTGLISISVWPDKTAAIFLGSTHLGEKFQIACHLLLINVLINIFTGALSGLEAFKEVTKLNIIKSVVFIVCILLLFSNLTLDYALIFTIISGYLSCIYGYYLLKGKCRNFSINMRIDLFSFDLKVVRDYSLPAFFMTAVTFPTTWYAQTILAKAHNGYSEIGVLNAANQWQNFIMLIPTMLSSVALPLFSSEIESEDGKNGVAYLMNKNQKLSVLVIIPIAIVLFSVTELIMGIYGTEYKTGKDVLLFILLGISISAIGYPAGTFIQARGKMWLAFTMNFLWSCILVASTQMFSERLGAFSYALGFSAAHIFLLVWGYLSVKEHIPADMLKRTFLITGLLILLAVYCYLAPAVLKLYLIIPLLAVFFYYALDISDITKILMILRQKQTQI